MKTQFFKETRLEERNIANLQKLASLSQESVRAILDWIEAKKAYPRNYTSDIAELSDATGESATTLMGPLAILRTFIGQILEFDEKVDDFYADLKALNVIDEKTGYKTLDLVFLRLPVILEKVRSYLRCRVTETYGLPFLSGSNMTAALKPVFPRKFLYARDSIEQYNPKPIAYCVVAQIQLENSEYDPYVFQLNRDTFDRFLSDLLALQAEMRTLEEQAQKMNTELCEA